MIKKIKKLLLKKNKSKIICLTAYSKNFASEIDKYADIILVEGMKNGPLKKIEVFRSELKKPLLYKNDENIIAIVADKIDKRISNIDLPVFNFKETQKICNFILKEVKNSKI